MLVCLCLYAAVEMRAENKCSGGVHTHTKGDTIAAWKLMKRGEDRLSVHALGPGLFLLQYAADSALLASLTMLFSSGEHGFLCKDQIRAADTEHRRQRSLYTRGGRHDDGVCLRSGRERCCCEWG